MPKIWIMYGFHQRILGISAHDIMKVAEKRTKSLSTLKFWSIWLNSNLYFIDFPWKKTNLCHFILFVLFIFVHFSYFFFHFDGFLHQQVFSICYTGVIHKLHSIWEWNKNRTYFFINSNLKLLVFSAIKSNFYIPAIESLHKTIRGTRLRLSILDSKKFNSQLNWENSMFY